MNAVRRIALRQECRGELAATRSELRDYLLPRRDAMRSGTGFPRSVFFRWLLRRGRLRTLASAALFLATNTQSSGRLLRLAPLLGTLLGRTDVG